MGFNKCIMSCIHHYSIIQNSFTTKKKKISVLYLFSLPLLPPSLWQALRCFGLLQFYLFHMSYHWDYIVRRLFRVACFYISFHLKFIHRSLLLRALFSLLSNIQLCRCTMVCFSICLLFGSHIGSIWIQLL